MAGFISGFRAGRSDELQRQQLKSQDQALRYKMGIDAEDRVFKFSKEMRDQATFQRNNDNALIKQALGMYAMGEEVDSSPELVGAFNRSPMKKVLMEDPNALIADISVTMSNLGSFQTGQLSPEEAWSPEVERVLTLAMDDRLNMLEGQSINGRPIIERKIMGIRPAINAETGEMRMEGNDPILNVMIAVKDQQGGDFLKNEDGSLALYPLTELGTADPNDQLEPIRVSSLIDRIQGIDQTAKFKKIQPDAAKTLLSTMSGSGISINTVESTKQQGIKQANIRSGKVIDEDLTVGNTSMSNIQALSTMSGLMDSALRLEQEGGPNFMGAFGELKLQMAKIGEAFGMTNQFFDSASIANASAFFAEAGKMSLQFIQQTKGAISEKEMALFAQMSTNLNLNPEGNRLIIAIAMNYARSQDVLGRAAADFTTMVARGEINPETGKPYVDADYLEYKQEIIDRNSLFDGVGEDFINQVLNKETEGGVRYIRNEDGSSSIYARQGDGWVELETKQEVNQAFLNT